MPILQQIHLAINVNQVLRAQGADPNTIKKRNPQIVQTTKKAIEIALPLISPKVLYEKFRVIAINHEEILLENGKAIHGEIVTQQLTSVDNVIAVLCTLGDRLENYTSNIFKTDAVLGFTLDAVGTVAVETLANKICSKLEKRAESSGLQTTIPLSPGMIGWDAKEGQTLIFNLLRGDQIGVTLTTNQMMIPRKSLSMLIGEGRSTYRKGSVCDTCPKRDTCQYRNK